MVGILEGVLIAGALALDVYAYKKMKDAEELAERKVSVQVTAIQAAAPVATPAPAPAAAAAGLSEAHPEEWKPSVTYETSFEQSGDEIRLLREELKNDFQNLTERVDSLDTRVREYHERADEKFSELSERSIEVPEERFADAVGEKISERTRSLNNKLDEQYKKLLEVENKVDSALISAPDTVLIKRDLREEFAPLFKIEKGVENLRKDAGKKIASLGRKVSALSKKPLAAKTVKKTKAAKKVTKAKKKTRETAKGKKAEVTVTTKVPKGVKVSTEVVTGKKK